MAVTKVSQREIVEVFYRTPEGEVKEHPALVLSTDRLFESEDGMFYAVLISSKNYYPDYTIKIENEWLYHSMDKQSYFVTHIVTFFKLKDIVKSNNNFIKECYFYDVLSKVIDSMFDVEVDFSDTE